MFMLEIRRRLHCCQGVQQLGIGLNIEHFTDVKRFQFPNPVQVQTESGLKPVTTQVYLGSDYF